MGAQAESYIVERRGHRMTCSGGAALNMLFHCTVLLLVLCMPVYGAAEPGPEAVVEMASRSMIDAIHKNRDELAARPQLLYELIETIVVPHFDVEAISRLVLGIHWRHATQEQRQRFTKAFKRLVIHVYAKALLQYTNEEIRVLPVPAGKRGATRLSVESILTTGAGKQISILYRLRMKNGVWKIYDLAVEGVSLIINYKQSFAEQIPRQGLEGLITSMEKKNALFRL
jgi:phospholipid transport system substrate-binding protein